MILAIDIGNSTVACGVFSEGVLQANWHLPSDPFTSGEEYGDLIRAGIRAAGHKPGQVRGVALCSVVPRLTPVFMLVASIQFSVSPLVASADLNTGLTLRYTDPRELGVDRLVAAAAAYARHRSWLILVDLGTATTFSVVSESGDYLGGAIAPGLGISADALAARTAQLPRVPLTPPPSIIARDTRSSIQSGLLFGHAALVDGMVERIQRELGPKVQAKVLATGGQAALIAPLSRTIQETRLHLTLEGLDWLYRRLQNKEK